MKAIKNLKKQKPLISLTKLRKKADKIFSLWIRNRDKSCYTCGSKENLQAGHFISRSYLFYRFDERNTNAQCVSCNVFKHGDLGRYAFRLIEQYGVYLIKEFERNKHKKINARQLYEGVIKRYGK